jgi:plastocyanin
VIALLLAAALVPGAAPKKKTVEVGDNYFAPGKVTVAKGATVTFKWPSAEEAGDVHDVKLKSGPKGAKTFRSEQASADYSYKRKLTVAGTYKLVCTLHEEMKLTVAVK